MRVRVGGDPVMDVAAAGASSPPWQSLAHAALEPEVGRNALLGAATAVGNLYAIPRHSGGESRVNVPWACSRPAPDAT